MIKVGEGRLHGSHHCSSCSLPEIDLDTHRRKEVIPLLHVSIGSKQSTSTSVLCWDCLNTLYAQIGIQIRRKL